jgi:TRAP-type C4-dicarboxylate transport system substrate-binding protein
MGSTEIFQSMQTGLLDGFTAQPLQDFRAKSLDTVTDYAIDVGLGIYHTGFFAINKDTFASLSPEVQAIIEQAAQDANGVSNQINMENTRAAIPETIKNGLELYSVDENVKKEMQNIAREATTTAWVAQAVKSGVPEETAKGLLDQFTKLTAEYDQNPQTMNYWEIYQKEFAK